MKNRGRPKKDDGLDRTVKFRTSSFESGLIDELSEILKTSKSDVIRRAVRELYLKEKIKK